MADVAQPLLLPGTVGTAIGQLTGSLVRALRERRQTVRALARCARLTGLLEAEPDVEALSFYPHLLAWELTQPRGQARHAGDPAGHLRGRRRLHPPRPGAPHLSG